MSDILYNLFKKAAEAQKNAYAPYSNFKVGAAIFSNGKIFSGCNVETADYVVIHAEGSAISDMIKANERKIEQIAVVGPDNTPCTPCGGCRQKIREFADEKTLIHIFSNAGQHLKTYTMEQLLPDSFGPDNLTRHSEAAL